MCVQCSGSCSSVTETRTQFGFNQYSDYQLEESVLHLHHALNKRISEYLGLSDDFKL